MQNRLTIADLPGYPGVTVTLTSPESPPVFRRGTQVGVSSEVKVTRPASEKSVALLHKLVAEKCPTVNPAYTASVVAKGQARVSEAIKTLLTKPKVVSPPAAKVNAYAGKCEECGTTVEAEAGTLTKTDEGKWEVAHRPGECPLSEFPFPVGRYAVAVDEVVHFFHAVTSGLFEQAGDTLYPVTGQRATEMTGLIALDPETASLTYGREIGACGRCGRSLTNEVSRTAGIGPICAAKGF